MTTKIDLKLVASLHAEMSACVSRLEETLKTVPRPPNLRRPLQPCEVVISTPYTRREYTLLLRAIRFLKRQPVVPTIDKSDPHHLAMSWMIWAIRSQPTGHDDPFAPMFTLLAAHVRDMQVSMDKWLDAAGWGIPF